MIPSTHKQRFRYLIEQRKADYYLSVKANQPTLLEDIKAHFLTISGKADDDDRISIRSLTN